MKQTLMAVVMMVALSYGTGHAQQDAGNDPPVVSELFVLKQENLALKQRLELLGAQLTVCQGQLAPDVYKQASSQLEAERQALIADFEKAHPGWTLDTATGKPVKKDHPPGEGGTS